MIGGMILGSHLSIAGGLHKALEKAAGYGFGAVALFVRNQVQWREPSLSDAKVLKFRKKRVELGIGPVIAHASYLVNLAGRKEIRDKSLTAMAADLDRCNRLGIDALVFHPGSNPDTAEGIRLIAEGLDEILTAVPAGPTTILLEGTAGQGNSVGCRFEHLAAILDRCKGRDRLGVCLDTCHLFAAGYDIRSADAYAATMDEFDRIVGLDTLRAIHLNDSKKPLGSRVDRHAHIGLGEIGADGFSQLVNDVRLAKIPMILETPKDVDEQTGRDWDEINFETLCNLLNSKRRK